MYNTNVQIQIMYLEAREVMLMSMEPIGKPFILSSFTSKEFTQSIQTHTQDYNLRGQRPKIKTLLTTNFGLSTIGNNLFVSRMKVPTVLIMKNASRSYYLCEGIPVNFGR